MNKRTEAAKRAARTRRHKAMIAAAIAQARHDTWEAMFRACAAENPNGSSGTFIRWFDEAWIAATKRGAR